jgi:hypothetical protein
VKEGPTVPGLVLSIIVLISLSVSAGGQAGAELAQVTLYSGLGHNHDFTRSSLNFESGERGYRETVSGFDLIYGNLSINYGSDWYRDWLVVLNPRSIVCDLGEKKWGDFRQTPSFPWKNWRVPLPLNSPMVFDASAGKKVDTPNGKQSVTPHRQSVMVRAGHMYLMRVMRGRSETYVMFRVESLTSGDNCVLSWKKVPPPEDDVEK